MGGEHHRLALGLDRLYPLPEVVAGLGIQPCGGFVQKQQFGIPEQGQGQQQALTLAPRELATVPVDELAQGAQIDEQLPWQGIGVEAGEQTQGIAHRQEILQRRVLELDADAGAIIRAARGAVKQDPAAVRSEDPLQQLDGRGLARPVRAEQAETAAGGNGKAEPVHRLDAGEVLDEIDDLDDGCHGVSPSHGRNGRRSDYIQIPAEGTWPVWAAQKQTATSGSPFASRQPDHRMSSSSTSNTRAEYGGMEPAPRAP